MEDYIYTAKNQKITVDADDKWRLDQYPWHTTNKGIVARARRVSDPDWYPAGLITMARELFAFPPNRYRIVHINGNKLDCRRSNLKLVTAGESQKIELSRKKCVNEA